MTFVIHIKFKDSKIILAMSYPKTFEIHTQFLELKNILKQRTSYQMTFLLRINF